MQEILTANRIKEHSMVSENKIKGKEKIKFVELGDRRKNKPIYVHVGGLNFAVKSQTLQTALIYLFF